MTFHTPAEACREPLSIIHTPSYCAPGEDSDSDETSASLHQPSSSSTLSSTEPRLSSASPHPAASVATADIRSPLERERERFAIADRQRRISHCTRLAHAFSPSNNSSTSPSASPSHQAPNLLHHSQYVSRAEDTKRAINTKTELLSSECKEWQWRAHQDLLHVLHLEQVAEAEEREREERERKAAEERERERVAKEKREAEERERKERERKEKERVEKERLETEREKEREKEAIEEAQRLKDEEREREKANIPDGMTELHYKKWKAANELYDRVKEGAAECTSSTTKEIKQLRLLIKKTINLTLNTVDCTMGSISSKADKLLGALHSSLSPPGLTLSPSLSTSVRFFAFDLLATKLLEQSATQIKNLRKSAYAYAHLVTAISADFPDLARLVEAHLVRKCVWVLPYVVPRRGRERKSGESEGAEVVVLSEGAYRRKIGFACEERETKMVVTETEDRYVERMCGYIYFYAALLQSLPLSLSLPPGGALSLSLPPHISPSLPSSLAAVDTKPLSLCDAWAWLAAIVNVLSLSLSPSLSPSLSTKYIGPILMAFLQISGFRMAQRFGGQFRKMIVVLRGVVMERERERERAKAAGGDKERERESQEWDSATRVKIIGWMEEYLDRGRIEPPEL